MAQLSRAARHEALPKRAASVINISGYVNAITA